MELAEKLAAIEALKTLKARYFLHLDRKEWAEWGAVFAPDVVMDVSGQFPDAPDPSIHVYRGRAAVVASVSGALAGVVTVHHGHMPIIEVQSATEATGIWAMEDNLFMPEGARMLGYGHYTEGYRCIDGAWCIAATRLTRLKIVYTVGNGQA